MNLFADTPDWTGFPAATFSPCGLYRYTLRRTFRRSGPIWMVTMLNPSTADAERNDPTVARMCARARRAGAGALLVANLFAWRATNPKELAKVPDPVGPGNDVAIVGMAKRADVHIVAWGADEAIHLPGSSGRERHIEVRELIERTVAGRLLCLGTSKDGHPRHPLYLASEVELTPW